MTEIITPGKSLSPIQLGINSLGDSSFILHCWIKALPIFDFIVSRPIAGRTLLKSITLWFVSSNLPAGNPLNIGLRAGVGVPDSIAKLQQWEPIVPQYFSQGGASEFTIWADAPPFTMVINKLYDHNVQRFGMDVTANLTLVDVYALFVMKEGV